MNPSHYENLGHRRGFVLGQTLAEVMTLIIFVLLLSLGIHILGQDREREKLYSENEDLQRAIAALRAVIKPESADLSKRLARLEAIAARYDETVRQLEEARSQLAEERQRSQVAQADLENFRELIEGTGPENSLEKLRAELRELKEFRDTMATSGLSPHPSALEERLEAVSLIETFLADEGGSLESVTNAIREAERLRGQLASAQRILERTGRGGELPSCWATEDGRSEYIYDVNLRSDGVIVKSVSAPHRDNDKKLLPISAIQENVVLTEGRFIMDTLKLYKWSEERECRFYIRVWDGTGATQKEIYKSRLRAVESHFYKLLMSGTF